MRAPADEAGEILEAAASGGIVMPHNQGIGYGLEGEPGHFGGSYRTLAPSPGPQPNVWGVTGSPNVMVSGNTAQATYTNASALLAK